MPPNVFTGTSAFYSSKGASPKRRQTLAGKAREMNVKVRDRRCLGSQVQRVCPAKAIADFMATPDTPS
jgi:hypothetical protein